MEERQLEVLAPSEAVAIGEGQQIEWMQGFPDNAWDLRKEIAAFAASNPGLIFLGISNVGDLAGIDGLDHPEGKDEMMRRIDGVARGVKPSVTVQTSFPVDEATQAIVVRILVPSCPEPVYYVGDVPYLRSGQESRPANPDEVKELHRRYFEQTGLLSFGVAEPFNRFKAQELAEIKKLHLGEGVSWLAFVACPDGPAEPFLNRLQLDEEDYQSQIGEILTTTCLPDQGTMSSPTLFIPEEDCIRLVWGRDETQPIEMLKVDVNLCTSWGASHGGSGRDTLPLLAIDWWCTWFLTVLGRIYTTYDTNDEITTVKVCMFLRNFKDKLLEVPVNIPGFTIRYRYRGDEDPRLFPRGEPLVISKRDLLENPEGITKQLVGLFRRSYRLAD